MAKDTEREQLEKALVALEAQRAILGDAAVDAAIAGIQRQLAERTSPASATVPAHQRKQITVLFADISGFTTMSEALDAEAVHELVNAVWESLDRLIVEHGGYIDKHVGDGVMALWGVSQAQEDDPEWAVRVALLMQQELVGIGEKLAALTRTLFLHESMPEVRMRIGINTGPVLLGEVGTMGEFSAIGDAVNLASRLQEVAPVGGVLISHQTYHHVRGIFDVQAQTPLTLKGKVEPVQTYLVLRAKPRAFRMRTRGVEGIETRMVGRDAELAALQAIFNATVEESITQVVVVSGEAGVGKSRLLYEFENWLDLLSQPVFYFKGRATPEMQALPHGIIRDMFAHRFDIRESDSPQILLEKFRAGMQPILEPDQSDLIGQMVGFDFQRAGSRAVADLLGSASFRQLALAYFSTYIRAVAQSPMVIFLEDLHWADDRSLELLAYMVRTIPDMPLLVVCLARPNFFERYPQWDSVAPTPEQASAPRPVFHRLDLQPLSREASSALVTQILQRLDVIPPALCNLIVEGAEGNPFYMEELIKVLIDDGVIVRGEDHWQAEELRLKALRVPPTLTGVLQARLDSLPRAEQDVLQRASVMGRFFWDAAVAELLSEDGVAVQPAELDRLLGALSARELIFRRTHSAFQDAAEYIFKHAILRDVAYEMVLLKVRRLYHARAAHWLEAHAGERLGEYLNLIAGHYELAGEPIVAADYWLQAGATARAVSAYRDAVAAFERALSLLPENELARRAKLSAHLGYAQRQLSDYPTALQCLHEGLALARTAGDVTTEIMALNGLGWALMGQGKYDDARPYLTKALMLGRKSKERQGVALALHHLGDVAYRQGDSDAAARYAWECLALYRSLSDRMGIAGAFRILGFVAYMRGQYGDAMQHYEASRRMYEEIGDRWGVGTGYINLGEASRRQGHFTEAAHYYEQSLPFFRTIGNRFGIAIALLNLGHVYSGMDAIDTAWTYFCDSLEVSRVLGSLAIVLECLIAMAWVRAKRGQPREAAEWLGLVQAHPEYNAEIAQFATPILDLLHSTLSPAELDAALARGATLDLDEIVREALAKCETAEQKTEDKMQEAR
ncbi:MAG: tetratricopeptide repeat protein [Anaerolineae bacterium]|nr:tetratricopeptide repeat protein [Anaerolineae bacterium]